MGVEGLEKKRFLTILLLMEFLIQGCSLWIKINLFCSVLWMCTSVAGLFSYYTLAAQTLPQSKTEEQLKLEEMEAKTPKAAESSLSAGTDTAALITLLPEDHASDFRSAKSV
jgi:hypothetical protein